MVYIMDKEPIHGQNGEFRGDYYVGQYRDGVRDGYGTYKFSSGKEYIGEWKNDVKHGIGIWINMLMRRSIIL